MLVMQLLLETFYFLEKVDEIVIKCVCFKHVVEIRKHSLPFQ